MADLVDELLAAPVVEDRLVPLRPPGQRRLAPPDAPDVPPLDPRDLPVVSIGNAYVERVPGPDGTAAAALPRSFFAESLLFLVIMACSFRPIPAKVTVPWARFATHLLPDQHGNQPIARDLYPFKVERETHVTTKLGLSPSLKFANVEASIGEFSRSLEYPRVEPVISAAGQLTATASWDFTAAAGHPLHGGKLLCALVAAPRDLRQLSVSLAVAADLDHRGLRLPAWLGGRPQDPKPKPEELILWKASR